MIIGQRTQIYTDVKTDIKAGMQFGTKNYKIKIVGFEIVRLYYDNKYKDCQVGSERIKRVINYK
jgi:hypothetical protein